MKQKQISTEVISLISWMNMINEEVQILKVHLKS